MVNQPAFDIESFFSVNRQYSYYSTLSTIMWRVTQSCKDSPIRSGIEIKEAGNCSPRNFAIYFVDHESIEVDLTPSNENFCWQIHKEYDSEQKKHKALTRKFRRVSEILLSPIHTEHLVKLRQTLLLAPVSLRTSPHVTQHKIIMPHLAPSTQMTKQSKND